MNNTQRNKIILDNIDLIKSVSTSYYGRILSASRMYSTEDIINELIPVMIRCISRYDPLRSPFRRFCRKRMVGHVLDLIRTHNHVNIPRSVWKKHKEQGYETYEQFYQPFSIDSLVDEKHLDTFADVLSCKNASQEELLLLKEFGTACVHAFNSLGSRRTKKLINAHAFHGHTLTSLSDMFGVTASRLSQISKKARKVMLVHVKKVYPLVNIEQVGMGRTAKPDKRLSATLKNIGTPELIRFVAFLTKDRK